MDNQLARPPLHELIAGALDRAARVQEDSRALIAECRRARVALRETVDTAQRQRGARAAASTRPSDR